MIGIFIREKGGSITLGRPITRDMGHIRSLKKTSVYITTKLFIRVDNSLENPRRLPAA